MIKLKFVYILIVFLCMFMAGIVYSDEMLLRIPLISSQYKAPKGIRFAEDSDLGYERQTILPNSEQFTVQNEGYRVRFLPLVNPYHRLLQDERYRAAIAEEKAKGRRISLVHFLPEEIRNSQSFQNLIQRLKESKAFKNGKLHIMPEEHMHFTILGGLQNKKMTEKELIELINKSGIVGSGEVWLRMKGPWANHFIGARVFLRNYPQIIRENKNGITLMIERLKSEDKFKVYATAFFQLKDDLTEEDDPEELVSIFNDFADVLAEYPMREVALAAFDDDLLGNLRIIKSFSLVPSDISVEAIDRKETEKSL